VTHSMFDAAKRIEAGFQSKYMTHSRLNVISSISYRIFQNAYIVVSHYMLLGVTNG